MGKNCIGKGMNEKKAREVAKNLVEKPEIGPFWSELALETWLRCGCCCVYCGRDMLSSREITYHFSASAEHLLPRRNYSRLETEPSNFVLACRRCNSLKGRWDPNTEGGQVYTASDGTPLTEEQRRELISRVKQRISPLREKKDREFEIEKKLILEAMLSDC